MQTPADFDSRSRQFQHGLVTTLYIQNPPKHNPPTNRTVAKVIRSNGRPNAHETDCRLARSLL